MDYLQKIKEAINGQIALSKIVDKVYGYAFKTEQGFAEYIGDGQGVLVTNYDNHNGSSHLILKSVNVAQSEDLLVGGGEVYTHTIQIEIKLNKLKSEVNCNSPFALYQELLPFLNSIELRNYLTARQAKIRVRNVSFTDENIKWAFLTIPIDVVLQFNVNCIQDFCITY